MGKINMLARIWTLGVDRAQIDSSPLAREYAEQLLDIMVAGSVQSLQETRDCLRRLEEKIMRLAAEHESQYQGFRRTLLYKRKAEAFEAVIKLLAEEVKTYDQRITDNQSNNGQPESE